MEFVHELNCDYENLISTLNELGWEETALKDCFKLGQYRLCIVKYGNFYTATLGIPQ